MGKLFWWLKRDKEVQDRMEKAREESRSVVERMASETDEAKERAKRFREINRHNHLAEIFDEAYERRRD